MAGSIVSHRVDVQVTIPPEIQELMEQEEEVFVQFEPGPWSKRHPMEHGPFIRHTGIPGHDQERLGKSSAIVIGAGGLGFPVAQGLVRSGIGSITVCDGDVVELANTSRQFYQPEDIGHLKGVRIAYQLADQMPGGGTIVGIGLNWPEVTDRYVLEGDLLLCLVDNNRARLEAAKYARNTGIPAIFAMLSRDGMRTQVFLQSPRKKDPCLWCALPDLDPEVAAPCAAAIVESCQLVSAWVLFFAHRVLTSWPKDVPFFNFRFGNLLGVGPEGVGWVKRNLGCERRELHE